MATPYYPIKDLSDILAKFRLELELALEPIRERLDALESRTGTAETGYIPDDVMKTEYYKYEYPVEEETGGVRPLSMIAEISAARRALYGYGMLATELGLPKEMGEQIRHFEQLTSAVMRLYQTMILLQAAQTAFEAGTPMGWLMIILAGGSAAASLVYTGRAVGG
jgi:hypothetical protein